METIRKLIADDPEALALWTEAFRSPVGINRPKSDINIVNIPPAESAKAPATPAGNSAEQALRRLNKAVAEGDERAAEVQARVFRKELSPHAAAVEMGWRKRPTPYAKLCAAWRKASEEERCRFAPCTLISPLRRPSRSSTPTPRGRPGSLSGRYLSKP